MVFITNRSFSVPKSQHLQRSDSGLFTKLERIKLPRTKSWMF